jgi:hypothetical protein
MERDFDKIFLHVFALAGWLVEQSLSGGSDEDSEYCRNSLSRDVGRTGRYDPVAEWRVNAGADLGVNASRECRELSRAAGMSAREDREHRYRSSRSTQRRHQAITREGVAVSAVRDDLEERGVDPSNCITGVKLIRRNDIALLLDDYNQVWHW